MIESMIKSCHRLCLLAISMVLFASCGDNVDDVMPDGSEEFVYKDGMEIVSRFSYGNQVLEESWELVKNLGSEENPALFFLSTKHTRLVDNGESLRTVEVKPGSADARGHFCSLTMEELDNFIDFYAKAKGWVSEGGKMSREARQNAYSKFQEYLVDYHIDPALFIYAVRQNEKELSALEKLISRVSEMAKTEIECCQIIRRMVNNNILPSKYVPSSRSTDESPHPPYVSINQGIETQSLHDQKFMYKGDMQVDSLDLIVNCYHPDYRDPSYYTRNEFELVSDQFYFYHGTSGTPLCSITFHYEVTHGRLDIDTSDYVHLYGFSNRYIVDDSNCVVGQHVNGYWSFQNDGWISKPGDEYFTDRDVTNISHTTLVEYGDALCCGKILNTDVDLQADWGAYVNLMESKND